MRKSVAVLATLDVYLANHLKVIIKYGLPRRANTHDIVVGYDFMRLAPVVQIDFFRFLTMPLRNPGKKVPIVQTFCLTVSFLSRLDQALLIH